MPLAIVQSLAVFLCLSAGCATHEAITYDQERWTFAGAEGSQLTTDHYVIYTTVDDGYLVSTFPTFVEAAYREYASVLPPAHDPNERMPVYMFATRGQFLRFTQERFPARAVMLGRVRNGGFSHDGVSVIQYVTHGTTFPLLSHEGFHQYVHHCIPNRLPAWLNEGLAVQFEGHRWRGDRRVRFDPEWNDIRRQSLQDRLFSDRVIPLRVLLRTHAGEVLSNSPPGGISGYYAQIGALVGFLRERDGPYAEEFSALLQALREPGIESRARAAYISSDAGEPYSYGEELFRAFIDSDVSRAEAAYVRYMRRTALNEK